jgi:large subunit ribosomal protein L23
MNTDPYYILKAPVITEESTLQQSTLNKYAFRVDPKANKKQIRDAIESMWDVRVVSVNTMNYEGKMRYRYRGVTGRKPNWKKAVVTLAPGDSIDLI